MTRTDIHRPKTVEPTDYTFVDAYELNDREGNTDPRQFTKDVDTLLARGLRIADHLNESYWAGVCGTCGQRGLTYVALMIHKTTGEFMVVGSTCIGTTFEAARMELDKKQAAAAAARKEAKLLAGFNAAVAAEPVLAAAVAKLEELRAIDGFEWRRNEHALQDIVGKCRRYGNGLSERQTSYVEKLIGWIDENLARTAKWAAERDEQRATAIDAPAGRTNIVGQIIKADPREDLMGRTVIKITVLTDAGYLVWCTLPSALEWDEDEQRYLTRAEIKGRRIGMTATLEPSEKDAKFAFGKRPAKAKFVA